MEQQSLYERLGGVNAIAMVVDRFSDAIDVPEREREEVLAAIVTRKDGKDEVVSSP